MPLRGTEPIRRVRSFTGTASPALSFWRSHSFAAVRCSLRRRNRRMILPLGVLGKLSTSSMPPRSRLYGDTLSTRHTQSRNTFALAILAVKTGDTMLPSPYVRLSSLLTTHEASQYHTGNKPYLSSFYC